MAHETNKPAPPETPLITYNEDSVRSLDWREHIRLRPGMYIGKLGDGSAQDDGIYILLKEVIDNCIDEYVMGYGKKIEIKLDSKRLIVRDYGRGIPLGKVIECVSKINTGAKYDSKSFQKSVGLNGVGTKAVNALSASFSVQSVRDGQVKLAEFKQGELVNDHPVKPSSEPNGTKIIFEPDEHIFRNFHFIPEFIESQIWNYAYLNAGLNLYFNNQKFYSQHGLLDLLSRKTDADELCYPIIHLKNDDFEVAITHGNAYGEEYYSFVNGQYTPLGGTHLAAFKEGYVKTIREFYGKNFDTADIRSSIIAAISIRVQEPVFESQTKTKLGSLNIDPNGGQSVRGFVSDFLKANLDNFLHKHKETAEALQKRILKSERERKELADVKKLAKKRAKTAAVHNRKLRDCRFHLTNDAKEQRRFESTLFITEGDSASGSLTKSRNVETQAVFSLRGKPLNCYGLTKKIVYENEEFNLLQHALDIEDGIEGLRYNKIVVATDADVDGMHIRLLLLTFFLQFFPDVVRNGHLYILETPLFRVRDKQQTFYCYDEKEKRAAIKKLKGKPEITRFKGLGEISPDEFGKFIGSDIRLDPVILTGDTSVPRVLEYYMGRNTPDRQLFIIENLHTEEALPTDNIEEVSMATENI